MIGLVSLRTRVTAAAALVLLVFVGLADVALEQAFQASARSAREERLLGQLYLLMAAADTSNGELVLPPHLAEARFGLPGSGLYGQINDAAGAPVWRSASVIDPDLPLNLTLPPGERRFEEVRIGDERYFVEGYGVLWTLGPRPRRHTFTVAEDQAEYRQELRRFRASLSGWLRALSLVLLGALLLALRWGLAPLQQVASEVAAVEAGSRERLVGRYPRELRTLTDNLNALLAHERARQARLGNALSDLAHSLKNPLAVMRGVVAEIATPGPRPNDHAASSAPRHESRRSHAPLPHPGLLPKSEGEQETPAAHARAGVEAPSNTPPTEQLLELIRRMDEIVAYQLEGARSRTPARLAAPVSVAHTLERLRASMEKLHGERRVEVRIAPGLSFRGVEGDLMEVLGNLLDNAYKWCRTRIRIGGRRQAGTLILWVEDDGPGIPSERVRQVVERGARADSATPGHGIGLAIVQEICVAYGGRLSILKSPLGGALVRVELAA